MKFSVLKRVMGYCKPYNRFFIAAIVSAIIQISLTLYGPILVGQAVDYMIGYRNVDHIAILQTICILSATIVVSTVFQWIMAYCIHKLTYLTTQDMRVQTYQKLNTMPLKYLDGHAHGDIISRLVNDVDQVADGLLQGFTQFFTGIVTIVGTIIFMLTISPLITLVVVLITPLSIFVAAFIAKLSHKMFVKQQAIQGQLSGHVEELVGNQKLVKTFHYEDRAFRDFREINEQLRIYGQKAQFYSALSNPSTRFVNNLVYAAVVVVGSVCAITGVPVSISIGGITSFLTYANQYTKPFNEVTGVITQIQTAFASAERLFEVLDETSEPADAPDAIAFSHCKGEVDISHLSFSYSPDTKLIEDFNLHVNPGDRVAIVGPTGCGKTTFINLLMRFYDANSGTISIDGIPTTAMTKDSLRSQFGMVLQDTWLYHGTIRDNIAYGKPNATDEEVIAAAKAAFADSFIMQMPNGYDTVIAEDGGNLSQGQKQLLCIARVMLVNPPMLILDEATSSIDTRTELKVQAAFQNIMEGRTSFIVAHRLSTIQNATTILVMEQGRIIEQGNHQTLLSRNGFYAKLYHSQFENA